MLGTPRCSSGLGLRTSRDTLLWLLRTLPDPKVDQVAVLGVDDFAFRRGRVYGTVRRLLRACLDAYGWGHRRDDRPQAMLAFTLLHDFNRFRPDMQLDRFATLDELANAIWGLS